MGKRVLLTGATGFVGANLARRLLGEGHELHLLVRPERSRWRLEDVAAHVRWYEIGLADEERLTRLVTQIRPEWIFHLAAHGAYPAQVDRRQIVDTNILGTMNLVEACLKSGFEAFVNTGSSSEYGFKDHPPAETEALTPGSYYAVTKAAATLYCRYVASARGVNITTLRLYSVYGPYEEPSRLMPTLILFGLEGKLPPLVEPAIARDFVHVDDVAAAYCLAARRPGVEPGAIYNVGSGAQTTLGEVVELARSVLGVEAEPQWGTMPNRDWDTTVWVADNRKISAALGWRAATSLEDGFRGLVRWFEEHPEMLEFYRQRASWG